MKTNFPMTSFLVALVVLVGVGTLTAQVPRQISYQGILTDANGTIVPDGSHSLTMTLYDAATGGGALYTETQNVQVARGVFNVILGSTTPIPANLQFNRAYFLGVGVDGGSELTPRTPLTAAPYTLYASSARFADSSRRSATADVANSLAAGATGAVTSVNGQSGAIQLVGAGSTTISSSGNQFTISSTTDQTGITEIRNTNGTIQVTNAEGPIVTVNVAPGSIGARELSENSVGSLAIVDGAVTARKIANEAFEEPKIANGAVSSSKLADGAVTPAKLADNAVTTAKIANSAVTAAKISGSGAVTGQALIFNGTSVGFAFPAAGALTLPYAQTASNGNVLFSMTNTGTGGAASFSISNAGSGGAALFGVTNGSGAAVHGSNTGSGSAVLGVQSGTSGRAGYFQNSSAANASNTIEATNAGSTGAAVLGTATGGPGLSGSSSTGFGVAGTSTSGRAGNFTITNAANANNALFASTVGVGTGVSALSSSGFGMVGQGATNRVGVVGSTSATFNYLQGSGVVGYSPSQYGVSGVSETGFAVLGYANGSAWAGYFVGNAYINSNLTVVGSVSKASGSFKIDHPLDPANKYLYHSFVESPDMMNIYNGMVMLDEHGTAEIVMPEWFSVLNQDFRYQLTAVGSPAPNLFVAEKMQGNRFRIAGGAPGQEISWQVTGIRHDPYAQAHRIQVEVEKPAGERGRYLHPDLYGQPMERSMVTVPQPQVGSATVK